MVCAGISLGGQTDLHVFHKATPTAVRYWNEILVQDFLLYAAAIGNEFIVIDDNTSSYPALLVEDYLGCHGFERMQ